MPRLIEPLIQEFEQESQATRRCLERIPEDKLSWKPHEKSFTLGQLALHVASTPGGAAAMLSGMPSLRARRNSRVSWSARGSMIARLSTSCSVSRTGRSCATRSS